MSNENRRSGTETKSVERLPSRELHRLAHTIWVGDEASEKVTVESTAGVSFVRQETTTGQEIKALIAVEESWPDDAKSGFEWPVTRLEIPDAWRDRFAAFIMPNIKPKQPFGSTTSLDRIALECSGTGELLSFALGDGVSMGKASAGVADVATRYFTRVMANLPPGQFPLSKEDTMVVVEAIADRLYQLNPIEEIGQEMNARRTPKEISDGADFSALDPYEAGGTTLLGGSIRKLENGNLKVSFVRLGDGGYILIDPEAGGAMYNLIQTPLRGSPAQFCVGLIGEDTPELDSVTVEEITVKKGSFLLIMTDGLPRSQISQTIQDLNTDLKGNWDKVPAEGLARLILQEASGLAGSNPQPYDDRSIVVIKA